MGPSADRPLHPSPAEEAVPFSPALRASNAYQASGFEEFEDPNLRHDPSFPGASPLLHSTRNQNLDGRDDDRTRLIDEAQSKVYPRWSTDPAEDPERSAGFRRHSTTPAPLKNAFVDAFHDVSMRVANVHGDGPYEPLQHGAQHPSSTLDSVEETPPQDAKEKATDRPQSTIHLRGHALGFLGPTNPVRVWLYKLLIHPYTQPTLLALIIVNAVALVVQASRTMLLPDDGVPLTVKGYFHTWEDYVIFVLFVIFTIEALGRMCLAGLFFDPEVSMSDLFSFSRLIRTAPIKSPARTDVVAPLDRSASLKRGYTFKRMVDNASKPFSLPHSSHAATPSYVPVSSPAPQDQSHLKQPEQPTFFSRIMKSDVSDASPDQLISLPFQLDMQVGQSKIERNIPYLRQGWGRIDFLAIIGFWVSFALATTGLERGTEHIGIFRALSVLRIARLLAVTNGTTTIMRSLKIARPLLANVVYFIIFAMVLFAVIGVQSFKMSLRRSCTLLPGSDGDALRLDQTCGGHINATTLAESPFLLADGTPGSTSKGYICPLGQVCKEGENPFHGIESFDTVYYAALQIIVLASASTWARTMYQIIASEYGVASIFFIFGVLVLNFWLFNLLVAVIANSFSAIRVGTKRSAFGAAPLGQVDEKSDESYPAGRLEPQNRFKVWWSYTSLFWVALALASLVVEATTNAEMSPQHRQIIDICEFAFTLAFDVEIIVRIALEFPAWRNFFLYINNWLDLTVAIGSTIILIPVIRNSPVYPWLTFFQLARFFRVLLVVPRMKSLLMTVFGNFYGLVHMTLFVVLITFLAALFAIQLIQGDMPGEARLNFGQLFNSFVGVYQLLSGEDWTSLLYEVTASELPRHQPIIISIFFCSWLLFSNFIVMQMFIAVINENFEVAEEAKKQKQEEQESRPTRVAWLSKLNPYRWFKAKPTSMKVESPTATLDPGEADSLIKPDNQSPALQHHRHGTTGSKSSRKSPHHRRTSLNVLHNLFVVNERSEEIPLLELQETIAESMDPEHIIVRERNPSLDVLARLKRSTTAPAVEEDIHRAETIRLIAANPGYDRSLFIFTQKNPLRRLCQKLVHPSGGDRIYGSAPSRNALTLFQLFILLAVLGNVITQAIATPLYRRTYYMEHGLKRGAWFHITDAVFGLILVVEFLIKIIADGFLFTPNAYIRSVWNVLDFFTMVGLIVNVSFTLVFVTGLSRFVRALKALQALRLMSLFGRMRKTFEDLILFGFIRILDAAVLAMLYIIPFSVWGTNIFVGLLKQCNDMEVGGKEECVNEYVHAIHENSFGFPVPRVWGDPSPSTTFSFDNFHSSLLILFEIVSQVGWIDVMTAAMGITGKDKQPKTNASQVNAIFFLIFNLLGGVIVLTLFVSIIIGNFKSRTGDAYLTEAQREWIDMQKLIKRLKPSKRPKNPPTRGIRLWCYERAIHKHGWWTRMMTLLFIFQVLVLMTQAFSPQTANDWHNVVSLCISFIYVVDVIIRFIGLGWRAFCANGWNIFDVLVALGSYTTTIFIRFYATDFSTELLQKLFLVSMTFKLVQRIAPLNQLFKTGTASLPVILNLLGLWLTFFIFFAIMYIEVFGMTKWYSAEDGYRNYQTMENTLLLMVALSTGEGWTQYMHDHTLSYPRCTQLADGLIQTDCGSVPWAFVLFISWNLLSMCIFLNLFTGVVVDSFSYVFQSTGGVLKSITRHETRAFKKAWAQFSNPETRLLERHNLARFLAKLDGVFEVRVYAAEASLKSLLSVCQNKSKKSNPKGGVSLRKLRRELDQIDFDKVRKRREVYARIYHEASLMCWRTECKGITFTEMLTLLAHHTLINPEEALTLKELETRRVILELVTELVMLDKARSYMRMKIVRDRYLQKRNAMQGTREKAIPEDTGESDIEEGWCPVQDPTTGSQTLVPSPDPMMGERTRGPVDLLDDPDILRSPERRRSEEMKLLQAEEETEDL